MKATQTATTSNENVNNQGANDMEKTNDLERLLIKVSPFVKKTNDAVKNVHSDGSPSDRRVAMPPLLVLPALISSLSC